MSALDKEMTFEDILAEVIDGLICLKSKPSIHDYAKNKLKTILDNELAVKKLKYETLVEARFLRNGNNALDFIVPDMSIVDMSELEMGKNGMLSGIPKLMVEVMSTNRYDDLYRKRFLYAEMGIPEYWIINLDGRGITQLVLKNGKHSDDPTMHTKGCVKHHICSISVDIEEFFPEIKRYRKYVKESLISSLNGGEIYARTI